MDKQTGQIPGDPNLRALLEQIVQNVSVSSLPAVDQTSRHPGAVTNAQHAAAATAPPATGGAKLTIEQQITQLRKQLSESYSLFMAARDSLASISFLNIDQQMGRKTAAALAAANSHLDAATTNLDFGPDSVEFLTAMRHRVGDIPEVATFFRVVGRLQDGIKRMEVNHKLWSDLSDDVDGQVVVDRGYVEDVRSRLGQQVSADELELAERMVDEQMAAEKRLGWNVWSEGWR